VQQEREKLGLAFTYIFGTFFDFSQGEVEIYEAIIYYRSWENLKD
jgi:hypothetical protein